MNDVWEKMRQIQTACRAARERTGNDKIGSTVEAGKFDLVETTYNAKGKGSVKVLKAGLSFPQLIAAFNRL